MSNRVKQNISLDDKSLGFFLNFYAPAVVEMAGYNNLDFVIFDNKHGGFSDSELENLIRAAECADITPIIRTSYDPSAIQKALDRGAKGVQVPMVETKEQAEDIVEKAKYPPSGKRGVAYSTRPTKYGMFTGEKYLQSENEDTLVIVHIETKKGVRNFNEIASVPGIDVAFIGAVDLSVDMGFNKEGQTHHEVQKEISNLYEMGKEKDIVMGAVANDIAKMHSIAEQGASYIVAVGSNLISKAFSDLSKDWNSEMK